MSNEARPLVTIGIPTYNRADGHLRGALESAMGQTYPNLEIVVADNGSTDHTETLVQGLSDQRIRYCKHAQNIGANENFNFCVDQANGDYFLLLHDDDLVDADFVEACMNAVGDSAEVGIIRTGTRTIDDDGNVLHESHNRVGGLSTTEFFMGWLEHKTALYYCSTMFNTRRLKEMGGFESKTHLFQDVVAELRLAASHGRADVYDIKASFRRHADNRGSASKLADWCEDSLYVVDTMCELASENEHQLREKALAYMCRKNYQHAAAIQSPLKRVLAYVWVHRRFGYGQSPLRFAYRRDFRPWAGALKRKLKQAARPVVSRT